MLRFVLQISPKSGEKSWRYFYFMPKIDHDIGLARKIAFFPAENW
jgi:hypothetical protein